MEDYVRFTAKGLDSISSSFPIPCHAFFVSQ
jgi:hypothetical protein